MGLFSGQKNVKGDRMHPVVPPNLTGQEWAVHDCYARIGILYFFSHWMTSAARRICQPKMLQGRHAPGDSVPAVVTYLFIP